MSDESAQPGQRAFLSAADPSRYFPAGAVEEARRRISRCIARAEGTTLLIGGAGVGKTLLLEVLAAEFRQRMSVVELIGAQLCTRRALLQMILFELGLPFRDMDEGELRLALHEYLKPAGQTPRRLLLLVDEADSLPIRLLEEIRALTNLAVDGAPLASVVLAGRAVLEELLADPKLDVFAQRLAARCYLSPFTREETLSYVRSQIAAAGADAATLMTDEALDAMHHAADGVPRLINQLGDQLLWIVEETGCQPLDASLVQQAWSDLQQLPAPWETSVPSAESSEVIEFGELDDEEALAIECAVERIADEATPPDLDALHRYDVSEADEPPASISIDIARRSGRDSALDKISSTIDDAEALLSSLEETESLEALPISAEGDVSDSADAKPSPAAQDPFAEDFDDEEVLIDQYVRFETSIHAATQRVVNFGDQSLASDLDESSIPPSPGGAAAPHAAERGALANGEVCQPDAGFLLPAELSENYVIAADASQRGDVEACEIVDETIGLGNQAGGGNESEPSNDTPTEPPDVEQTAQPELVAADPEAPQPREEDEEDADSLCLPAASSSEMLVVEDDDAPSAVVVRSRNFRRLFSCLESGETINQCGSP